MYILENVRDFKAGKAAVIWSCAACSVATMVVGFTWGGWVTGSSAQERGEAAAEQAMADLAADVCVKRYLASPEASVSLAALIEQSSYNRKGTLEDGGWVTLGGRESPVAGAGGLCAERLAEVDLATLPGGSVENYNYLDHDLTPTTSTSN